MKYIPAMKIRILVALLLSLLLSPGGLLANPYLAKPGDHPVTLRIATCAVSGGMGQVYVLRDYGLFNKYGLRVEDVYIRGSDVSLAALASDEIQALYCAGDATIPGMASGVDVKLVAAPLVGLPYVLVARKDIKRPEDLKGKSIGVTRPGDLSARLSRAVLKKFNLTDQVAIRPIGGSQSERYQAMRADIIQAIVVTPPLDVRAKHDGFNTVYRLIDLDLPFLYSSVHVNTKILRERPEVVQKLVAAFAESVYFMEKNPDKAKASIGKALRLTDQEALQAAYNAYAKEIVNRRLVVPGKAVAEAVEIARENGTKVRKRPEDLYDNSFALTLDKSGFLKELWGNELQQQRSER